MCGCIYDNRVLHFFSLYFVVLLIELIINFHFFLFFFCSRPSNQWPTLFFIWRMFISGGDWWQVKKKVGHSFIHSLLFIIDKSIDQPIELNEWMNVWPICVLKKKVCWHKLLIRWWWWWWVHDVVGQSVSQSISYYFSRNW